MNSGRHILSQILDLVDQKTLSRLVLITGDRNNQNILALAYWLWNPHFHGTQTLDRALGGL